MGTKNTSCIYILGLLLVFLLTGCVSRPATDAAAPASPTSAAVPARPWRILHVMSYESAWVWNQDQLAGFRAGLGSPDSVDLRVIEMNAKNQTTERWLTSVGASADAIVASWQPDLLYLNDDIAQTYVGRTYVNTDLPVVFSGVNRDPASYGYTGSSNVTGVLEQEHFLATIQLLTELAPHVKRIAIVIDQDATWDGVVARMRAQLDQLPAGVEIVRWDKFTTYAEFQAAMISYQTTVDAVGLLGVFGFTDETGAVVPHEQVLRWTTEQSRLPDFSFWDSRIPLGTLCTVTVSGYEQGLAAGKLARRILVDQVSPSTIEPAATLRGQPVINLARARDLGLTVNSTQLLASKVITTFAWDE